MIICPCSNISISDVKILQDEYPDMLLHTMKTVLNIGRTCGACQRDAGVGMKLEDAINALKIN